MVVAVSLMLTLSCGPSEPVSLNGYWLGADGGAGIVVFDRPNEQAWLGRNVSFPHISTGLSVDCSVPQRSDAGTLVWPDSDTWFATYEDRVVSAGDGGWLLQFKFPDGYVDRKYRMLLSNNPASLVGTVTGRFSGTMTLESASAKVSYRVEYRDSMALLSVDEGSFSAGRAETCQ